MINFLRRLYQFILTLFGYSVSDDEYVTVWTEPDISVEIPLHLVSDDMSHLNIRAALPDELTVTVGIMRPVTTQYRCAYAAECYVSRHMRLPTLSIDALCHAIIEHRKLLNYTEERRKLIKETWGGV